MINSYTIIVLSQYNSRLTQAKEIPSSRDLMDFYLGNMWNKEIVEGTYHMTLSVSHLWIKM